MNQICRQVLLFGLLILVSAYVSAQSGLYHRAKIDLKDKNPLLLFKAGVALDHGKFAPGRYFESDFSQEEINLISNMGFDVRIIIHDVETYYAQPNRPSELTSYLNAQRTNSCSQDPTDIKTPVNYFEGSMAGYFTYDEMLLILDWMHTLYPNLISKLDTIDGYTTHEGNVIHYLRLSDNPSVDEEEPEVLYNALHHAREPNSLSQMIFYLWYLLENYQSNPEIKYLVDHTEMYFIPCLNPDGYKLNEKNKPNGGGLWRKNGKKDGQGNLIGVDLNRNYGYEWGFDNEGSSPNPNSETYRGVSAFSEPETSAIREFCISHNFLLSLNYHTFGNYLIHPWGFSDLPTEEDKLFKLMGNVMTKSNKFKMGTGTETVGYTTNGDSDDYMYGDQVEKNKIYSYTPEVGPSFWPPKTDIDYLNKSCLEMNLALPRLAAGVIDHYVADASRLHRSDDTILIRFARPGFGSAPIPVNIYLDPVLGGANNLNFVYNKSQGSDTLIKVPYYIDPALLTTGKNEVKVFVSKDYGSWIGKDSFIIEVFQGSIRRNFFDVASNINNWQFFEGNWGITNAEYFSEPSSISDSPATAYGRNVVTTLRLANPIDLTIGKSPQLTFKTKWSIEKNYDYAIVYAYTLSGDTLYLCGKYTKPGTLDQKAGYPVYDGIQTTWVDEVMDLSSFEGEAQVFIDFQLVSDGFLEMDGMYIDDIEVITFKEVTTAISDKVAKNVVVYPNPGSGIFHFTVPVQGSVKIADAMGKEVINIAMNGGTRMDLSQLTSGIYQLSWLDAQRILQAAKLAIIR
ncbi:MAG: immune inhibitor A [Saprospiraceae bacterium]|nr:immune inhibitor A [Saprospiraceae bacterium]